METLSGSMVGSAMDYSGSSGAMRGRMGVGFLILLGGGGALRARFLGRFVVCRGRGGGGAGVGAGFGGGAGGGRFIRYTRVGKRYKNRS